MASAHAQRVMGIWANQQLADAQAKNTDLLNQGFATARTDLLDNLNPALTSIDTGLTSSLGALGTGYDAARTSYGDAEGMYQPYADAGLKALGAYSDSTGANGQGGYDNAVGSFRSSPGYQYQVDQASDAVARKASALGILGSGNTMTAISDRAQNLADQDYGKFQDRLQGLAGMGFQATGAQAGLEKGIGDLSAQQGVNTSNLFNTTGAQKAGIYGNLGTGLASLDTGLATSLGNLNLGVAQGQGANAMQMGQAGDAAKNANQNLLLGALGLGLGAGKTILSGGLSGLGGLFGGGGSSIIGGSSWT